MHCNVDSIVEHMRSTFRQNFCAKVFFRDSKARKKLKLDKVDTDNDESSDSEVDSTRDPRTFTISTRSTTVHKFFARIELISCRKRTWRQSLVHLKKSFLQKRIVQFARVERYLILMKWATNQGGGTYELVEKAIM